MNSYNNKETLIGQIFDILLAIYFISTQIMGIYFWWKMMKKDSFITAILIDPFIAEFKGLLWPFFI